MTGDRDGQAAGRPTLLVRALDRLIAIGGHPGNLSYAQFTASLELFQAEVSPVLRRTIPDPPWPDPVVDVRRRHA